MILALVLALSYIPTGLHFAGVRPDGGGGGLRARARVIIGGVALGHFVLGNTHYDQIRVKGCSDAKIYESASH